MAKWAKVDISGKVVEIVEDDAKPGDDYKPATDQTKVGDNLGASGQGNQPGANPGHGGQAPGQTSKPQPK